MCVCVCVCVCNSLLQDRSPATPVVPSGNVKVGGTLESTKSPTERKSAECTQETLTVSQTDQHSQ